MNFTHKKILFLFIILIFNSTSVNPQSTLPKPSHILIVILENHSYSEINGNTAASFINSLTSDSLSALFTQSYAITHPSQPNYLWLFSGGNQGITDDSMPAGTPFKTLNLASELLKNGYSFAGYSEDLPYTGFTGQFSGGYARKHNPWVNWQNADTNGIASDLNKPLTDFPTNYDSLPTVSFVIPNQNNDMHNGSDPSRITTADNWIQNHLDSYIQWAKNNNSLFILTFDEDDGTENNRIMTIFTGQMVKKGSYNRVINHLNLLRTIEEMYGLNFAGASKDSSAIDYVWQNVTNIADENVVPGKFSLEQNYPNPFNPSTTINYSIPAVGSGYIPTVQLKVYDILGREVATLVNKELKPGNYKVTFNASSLASGVYFYRIVAGNFIQTKKMVLVK